MITFLSFFMLLDIDDLVQNCSNSIANALFRMNPSI